MKKIRNEIYQRFCSTFPRSARVVRDAIKRKRLKFPAIISIELTNRCNAACIMCPRQFMTREQGVMEPALFEKILNELAENHGFIERFQPFLFGESLVHPKFPELIRLARQKLPKSKIYISTNAGIMGEKQIDAILEARVDKLNVDIDGFKAETAEAIRRQVKHAQVLENVNLFLKKRQAGNFKTKLRVSIIKMPLNKDEISDFVDYWRPLVDHVQTVDFNTWTGSFEDQVPEDDFIPFDFPCSHPYRELTIGWDGRISLCCLDFDMKHVVGNVNQTSIKEAWNGKAMQHARKAMESLNYKSLPICARLRQNISKMVFGDNCGLIEANWNYWEVLNEAKNQRPFSLR